MSTLRKRFVNPDQHAMPNDLPAKPEIPNETLVIDEVQAEAPPKPKKTKKSKKKDK